MVAEAHAAKAAIIAELRTNITPGLQPRRRHPAGGS